MRTSIRVDALAGVLSVEGLVELGAVENLVGGVKGTSEEVLIQLKRARVGEVENAG